MNVYIAAPLPLIAHARLLASRLRLRGHTVVSTWHNDTSNTPEKEANADHDLLTKIALTVRYEIRACETLILLFGPVTSRHGSIWESGYAEGLGKHVVLVPAGLGVLPTACLYAIEQIPFDEVSK